MGECLSPCLCTGAAGIPADLDKPRTLLQGKRPFHPRLQAQNWPLRTTVSKRSLLNCIPNSTFTQLKLQGLELFRRRCPTEPVLLPPTQGSLHPATGGLPRDPLSHKRQLPGEAGRVPREQSNILILCLLSLGVRVIRVGGIGDVQRVLTGPRMDGCL